MRQSSFVPSQGNVRMVVNSRSSLMVSFLFLFLFLLPQIRQDLQEITSLAGNLKGYTKTLVLRVLKCLWFPVTPRNSLHFLFSFSLHSDSQGRPNLFNPTQ
mmetsp:Transcript_10567/g.23432  ORF Transcript_10567/g.23432 Transcript_10567/m.23432 type:complete len:101 (-) Transcript_10567:515-817(-)